MKNKIYTTLLFSGLGVLLLFITACSHDPIFYDISKEIELEEATIPGNVNSIVKLGGNLYASNGDIYAKSVGSVRGWDKISDPSGRVVQLASNATHLYALTAEQTDNDGEAHSYQVWASSGGTGGWTKVTDPTSTNIVIFDNAVNGDASNTTGRNAYVRVGYEVKKLDESDPFGGLVVQTVDTTTGVTTSTVAAAYLSTKLADYFADTRAFCSNGTDTLYRASGRVIQSSPDGTDWSGSTSVDADPLNFAFTTGKILVGTDDGLQQVILIGNTPSYASDLDSNAEATIGESEIISVATWGTTIYAGAIKQYSTKWNALWAYYPLRGNWNLE